MKSELEDILKMVGREPNDIIAEKLRQYVDKVHSAYVSLAEYITSYMDGISVREQVNGKWGSYFLTELPVDKAVRHALRFIIEGKVPYRVVRESESSIEK